MNIVQQFTHDIEDIMRIEAIHNMLLGLDSTTNESEALKSELILMSRKELVNHSGYTEYVNKRKAEFESRVINNKLKVQKRRL